ncbi:hypothetical protein LCGC14_0928920 [marine sediment metagenome]|uniref:N-acetyltransferase domain-containing protein n=1 Tax=marine sediment metagenome TaxID=412755 RepID=A0A0F9RV60_9ZZZZ
MNFRAATQEDLAYVRQNPFEGAVKNYPYMEVPDSNTYAVMYESSLVAVGGLFVRWEGVGLFWLILTADCKKDGIHGFRALYAIREKVEYLIEVNNLYRAEAYVATDFLQAIKMIEAFGFRREGLMKHQRPDKGDSFLYAKTF